MNVLLDKIITNWKLQPTSTQSSRAGTLERTQGLRYFSQLLGQQPFLLTFIRTLEKQQTFSMKDKSRVAAMLMIALQDRLEYATIILQFGLIYLKPKKLTGFRIAVSYCQSFFRFGVNMLWKNISVLIWTKKFWTYAILNLIYFISRPNS